MKLKKVLSICKTNGLYYLYDRIDRSGEITQWLGDGYALYPLDGLPILDEESFCAVFDIIFKQRGFMRLAGYDGAPDAKRNYRENARPNRNQHSSRPEPY